ncbi:MAG: TldD/PmbA family protein [Kiritimatiellae bacterium]|nr:TldD/PmbA family protein [Kiritimatiellia bacterium]
MKDRLSEALKKSTADYAEIRFECNDSTSVRHRGQDVDDLSAARIARGIVRACTRGGWGEVQFDDLDRLPAYVEDACASAALVGRERTELAETDCVEAVATAAMGRDFRGVDLDEKLALTTRYNEILLKAAPKIETSTVAYHDMFRTVHFANSRGSYFLEERPYLSLHLVAVARDGGLVQRAFESVASRETFEVAVGLESRAEEAAARAAALLKAPVCEGGKHTVVVNPKLAGVFAHEAFGHLSEADFLYENPKMRDLMHIGREMGVKALNILDDGTMRGLIGTNAFDDEGTRAQKTWLIRDGVLAGHLHSLETAAKMGETPTGNARAVRGGVPPIVRMTNTYIDKGEASFEDLLAGIDKGIYACDMLGGQTMMEMFTFSAAHGYRIENGRKGELVRDVVLTGNVFETLHNIDGFGADLQISEVGGGCGKGGQAPLPVTFGAPHLRIRNLVVGGKG